LLAHEQSPRPDRLRVGCGRLAVEQGGLGQHEAGVGEVGGHPRRAVAEHRGICGLPCLGDQPHRQQRLRPVDRQRAGMPVGVAVAPGGPVVVGQGERDVAAHGGHHAAVLVHQRGAQRMPGRRVERLGPAQIVLRGAPVPPVRVQDGAVVADVGLEQLVAAEPA